MVQNFSFVIPGKLAGSAIPGYWQNNLEQELRVLKSKGINAIVSLTEWNLDKSIVSATGIAHYVHLPIPDFGTPTPEQIEKLISFIDDILEKNEGAVLVHCFAGQGRTGMMLAAYLISKGMTAEEAIEEIRKKRPGSIETNRQEERLKLFAKQLQQKKQKQLEESRHTNTNEQQQVTDQNLKSQPSR